MSHIDESIKKMNECISSIRTKAFEIWKTADNDTKKQIEQIADSTINTISDSIFKLNKFKEMIKDNDDIDDFLYKIEGKCYEVSKRTLDKLESLKPAVKEQLASLENDLEESFNDAKEKINNIVVKEENKVTTKVDEVKNNDNIQNLIQILNDVKDKAIKFYNDPKTQEAINEAKLKAIDLAEKGLDKLKEILDREDKKED